MLKYRSGLFVVGPESVGADPGPVCYRKGGQLAITDANLVLGRILPDFFPKVRALPRSRLAEPCVPLQEQPLLGPAMLCELNS